MHALYEAEPDVKKRVDAGKLEASDPDPAVQTGLALTDFDLQDYKAADDLLDPLINLKKLGTPQVELVENGETKIKDNDLYWEATYKYIKSDAEVNKNNPKALEVSKRSLKNLLIRGGIPDRWQDDFETLRKELTPEFNVTGPAPTTGPVISVGRASAAK